jgi:D-sedoheptulose 7-phosphate isomerase
MEIANDWAENIQTLHNILKRLSIWDQYGNPLQHDEGFERWKEIVFEARDTDNTIFFMGNGASASMASHFSADVTKILHIRTQIFTDLSLITACANDFCYEEVYAEPLSWSMKRDDMLIAISSSGNSPNIISAIDTAKSIGGKIVTLSAMDVDNRIRNMGDLNFYIPASTYGLAETCHAAILHYWVDLLQIEMSGT